MTSEILVLFANAEWDWANRVNCHHLATRLAESNTVLFVETIGGRTPAPREVGKVIRRLRRIIGGVRRVSGNLTVLSPFVIPLYGSEFVRECNTHLLAWQVRRLIPASPNPILWIFLPSLVGLVDLLPAKRVIYHCVDDHAANPNVPAEQVRLWERRLLSKADAVFTSAATLYEDKRALNPRTFLLPNVADTEHFAQALSSDLPVAAEMQSFSHPLAGYVGNLSAYKVDFDLLASAARARQDWSFILIGPIGRGDPSTRLGPLKGLPNVFLLGERAFSDLPCYVKAFDTCLIPYKQNPSTRGSLPIKFFEYLAAGKPVVAADLPALKPYRDLFYPADNVEEFTRALDATLVEDPSCAASRRAVAERYSWDARMKEIDVILGGIPPRSSNLTVGRRQGVVKRLFDIFVSALLLIVLSPLLLVIALAIRMSSGSPVLYEWNVVGQGGRAFKSCKFRTMVINADQLKEQLLSTNEMQGPVFKMRQDPRVTPIGRFLRKFSLDELPQLWSVLKGDMSLVGPRPPLALEYERFTPRQRRKLAVKPGMTCLWQVGGKPADFDEWLRLDLEYIERQSFWLDLTILFKTAWVVFTGKNT